MSIDTIFRKRRTSMLESFNYVDVATGQAIVTAYGFNTEDGLFKMSNVACWSHDIRESFTVTTGAKCDTNFDMDIDRYLILDGKVVLNLPMTITSVSNINEEFLIEAYLKKVDTNGTETLLDMKSFSVTRGSPGTSTTDACFLLSGARTVFGPGTKLRITISGATSIDGTDTNGTCGYGHDPKNRTFVTGDTTPSSMVILFPFKREL
jgi:hypothetical protein